MRQRRPILYFLLVFGACYPFLALLYPGYSPRYAAAYRRAGNAWFGTYGERGIVTFAPMDKPSRTTDTVVSTSLRGSPYIGDTYHSPRLTGFLPTVEYIALALGTPIAWRRRLVGLGVGLVALHVLIALRVRLALLFWFSTPDTPWRVHEFGDTVRGAVALLYESINEAPVASFVLPAIVWVIVMFRPTDFGGAFRFAADESDTSDSRQQRA